MSAPRPRRMSAIALLLGAALARGQAPPSPSPSPADSPPPSLAMPAPAQKPPAPTAVRPGVPARRVDRSVARATRDGNEALLLERPDDALQLYSKAQVEAPDLPELEYNRGLAALLSGDGAEAEKAFGLAQQLARQPAGESGPAPAPAELLEDSRYNAGHAAWAQDQLPQAIQGWASLLASDTGSDDARRNLELALRLLRQQQQEQQQQQKQDQQKDDQDKEEDQQPQPQPQDQKQDDQPQQGAGQQQQEPPAPEEQGQQPAPGELTKEQAEDLLDALEAAEKQEMREEGDKQARRIAPVAGKDW